MRKKGKKRTNSDRGPMQSVGDVEDWIELQHSRINADKIEKILDNAGRTIIAAWQVSDN